MFRISHTLSLNQVNIGLDVLHARKGLAHHHEHAQVSAYPLRCSHHAALHGVVGENVGEDDQYDVDGNFLAEFREERAARGILVHQVLHYAQHRVYGHKYGYPLGKFPILVQVSGDVCHNGKRQRCDGYHW